MPLFSLRSILKSEVESTSYNITSYGDELKNNKELLNKAFIDAGINLELNICDLMLAMGMLETNTLDPIYRDASKDDNKCSQNVSLFNLNMDMITYLGFKYTPDYLNNQDNLSSIVKIIYTAFNSFVSQKM